MADGADRNRSVKAAPRGHGGGMPEHTPAAQDRRHESDATRPEPRHETDVRRRKGIWTASCSCGWSSETMSAFTAWSATRRHLTDAGALALRPPVPRQPNVRLLD